MIIFPGVASRVAQIEKNKLACRREGKLRIARAASDIIQMAKLSRGMSGLGSMSSGLGSSSSSWLGSA